MESQIKSNYKSHPSTCPELAFHFSYLTLSALKKIKPMFSVQNEKGYNVFCFFPFKRPAFQFVLSEGGTNT